MNRSLATTRLAWVSSLGTAGLSVPLGLAILIFVSCHSPKATTGGDSTSAQALWQERDTSCDFDHTMRHPSPRQLVDDFVARAAVGSFASAEKWLPGAVDCIGHEPGYDTFEIVRGYSLKLIDSTADMVHYALSRDNIGYYSGRFHREDVPGLDTITVYRTPYGWRLKSPAPWNWITVKSALHEKWLAPGDTISGRP